MAGSGFCQATVIATERCDTAEARDAVMAFFDRTGASSSGTPALRQDLVNNLTMVHSALESLANGDAPPLSPAPSLPDSLDGWLGKQSSAVSMPESLDGWLSGDTANCTTRMDTGKQGPSPPGTPTSPWRDISLLPTVPETQTVTQAEWNSLVNKSLERNDSNRASNPIPKPSSPNLSDAVMCVVQDNIAQENSVSTDMDTAEDGMKVDVVQKESLGCKQKKRKNRQRLATSEDGSKGRSLAKKKKIVESPISKPTCVKNKPKRRI